jgi:hypothetical protein
VVLDQVAMLVKVVVELLEILVRMVKQERQLLLEVIVFLVALVEKKDKEILETQAILEPQVVEDKAVVVAAAVAAVRQDTIVSVRMIINFLIWTEAMAVAAVLVLEMVIRVAAVRRDNPLAVKMMV